MGFLRLPIPVVDTRNCAAEARRPGVTGQPGGPGSRRVNATVVVACVGFAGFAALAFQGASVPFQRRRFTRSWDIAARTDRLELLDLEAAIRLHDLDLGLHA